MKSVSRQARWARNHRSAINLANKTRRCKRYLLKYGNLPDAKRAALENRFYVQASVWESALMIMMEQRRNMNTETQGTTAAAEVEQHDQSTTAGAGAGSDNQAQAEGTEEKKEEPARTGATDKELIPPAVAAAPGQIDAGTKARSPGNAVVIRRLVTYTAGDDDVSHGVLEAGTELAAVIVKVNEDETVNLHAFAPDSAATLFLPGVKFGTERGQCRF